MADKQAEQIIQEWSRDDSLAFNTMALYQSVADHFFQRENMITSLRTQGEDKSLPVLDPTGSLDLQDMAAGLSAVIFPSGQYFCRLVAEDAKLNDVESIRSYLNYVTNVLHNKMFSPSCNFITEFNEFLMSLIGFGTGNIYCGWDKNNLRLFFKDWDVANYRFGVDQNGFPNRVLIKWSYTAEQAKEAFGENAGQSVIDAAKDPAKSQTKFSFIWRCRKRQNRNTQMSDIMNWPWEEICVSEKDKVKVFESGYKRMPYHLSRWQLSSQEIWGRGQGTIALSADKELQRQRHALLLCADLANNPPRQTLQSFEGVPKVYPGANNIVMEMDSVKALDRTLQGNFPITKDTIEMQQEILHRCFYVKVFAPLDNLPGDRRTTVEIIERVKAGYMRLVLPCQRLYNECLTPLVESTVNIMLENGMIPPPPAELRSFKVEYLGRLALALQEQQADALQRFAQFSIQMEAVVPGFTKKIINVQRAGRRMGTTFGINEGDFNTEEEVNAIVAEEQKMQQQQMALMAADAGSKAYKNASGKPEDGSMAEQMMGAVA